MPKCEKRHYRAPLRPFLVRRACDSLQVVGKSMCASLLGRPMDKKLEHAQLVEALDLGAAAPPGSGAGTVCGPRTKAPRQVEERSFALHRVEGSAPCLLAILLPETFTSIAFDGVAPIKGKPGRSGGSSTA